MGQMSLEIDGKTYLGFTSATASKSMENMSGEFTFEVSVLDDLTVFPIKLDSRCRVLVNGKSFMNGYIEKINISYSSGDHRITVSGRDKTADLIDNTIGSELTFSAGISLENIVRKVIDYFGLSNDISVSSNCTTEPFGKAELNNISAEIGETANTFIQKYAMKRQVLVMSDGDGNVLLARKPEGAQSIFTFLTSDPGYQGVILSADISYDRTKRFYKYVLLSQKNYSSNIIDDMDDIDNEEMISVVATVYDEGMNNRPHRTKHILQNDSSYNDDIELQNRAIWESNYRMAHGYSYNVTVQDFSPINDPGKIWQPNMLVTIKDSFCDVALDDYLLKSVIFKYSIDGGSTTNLEFVDKRGYSVEVLQGMKYKLNKLKKTTGSSVVSNMTPYQRMR